MRLLLDASARTAQVEELQLPRSASERLELGSVGLSPDEMLEVTLLVDLGLWILPILHHKAGNTTEFGDIVRHECASVRQGDGSNLCIIRPDHLADGLEMMAEC